MAMMATTISSSMRVKPEKRVPDLRLAVIFSSSSFILGAAFSCRNAGKNRAVTGIWPEFGPEIKGCSQEREEKSRIPYRNRFRINFSTVT
jgi:hypothetical protein